METNLFFRLLSRIVEGLVILGASVIVTIVTIEVVLRYVFGHSLIFTEELSRYLMVWVVFLGSAIAVRDNAHIRITVLAKRLNAGMRRLVYMVVYGLMITFLAIVTIEGLKILPRQLYQMCITIDVSMFYFYLAIPVGSILMMIFLVPHIKDVLSGRFDGDNAAGEGQDRS